MLCRPVLGEPSVDKRTETVKGRGRRLEVGLQGREPCCRNREVDGGWLECRQIARGVLGSKYCSSDTGPSFKQHSRADLQSSLRFRAAPGLLSCVTLALEGVPHWGERVQRVAKGQLKIFSIGVVGIVF